jgi:hypothetical protein
MDFVEMKWTNEKQQKIPFLLLQYHYLYNREIF